MCYYMSYCRHNFRKKYKNVFILKLSSGLLELFDDFYSYVPQKNSVWPFIA